MMTVKRIQNVWLSALFTACIFAGCSQTINSPVPDVDEGTLDVPLDILEDVELDDADVDEVQVSSDEGSDPGPLSCDPVGTTPTSTVELPLGETLFLEGDAYLAFWGVDHPCDLEVLQGPDDTEAEVQLDPMRITPDIAGSWILRRGGEVVEVKVVEDALSSDTFLNYNYTPVHPLVMVSEDQAMVASPPSNAVQIINFTEEGAETGVLIPTGGWPVSLAHWPEANMVLVAQAGRDTLGFLDLALGRIVDAIHVGNEPAGIIVDTEHSDGTFAYVTVSGADKVVKVDLEKKEVVASLEVGRDPRAVAFDAATQRLFVASLVSSNEHPRGLLQDQPVVPESQKDIAIVNTATFTLESYIPEVGTIIRGLLYDPNRKKLIAAVSHANNDNASISAESGPIDHALVMINANAELDSPYTIDFEVNLSDQESSGGPGASPFTMMLSPDGTTLWVTLSAARSVLAMNPEFLWELARVQTAHDPRGLLLRGDQLWTYSWLSNQIEALSLPLESGAETTTLAVGNDPTPPDIKIGQQIFNDGAFSRYGEFSCNNCHIDGLTDGLVWNLLVDGDVNTIAFRNIAGTNPFLWGGQLPTLFDFSREVLKLVGAEATGEDMEHLTRYMQSVTAPPNPFSLPGGAFTEIGLWGKEIFERAATEDGGGGCIACHSGPLFTNYNMVDGKTEGMKTDVPALLGVYDTAPYGRQGQWTSLEDMVSYGVGFSNANLDIEELTALLQYVKELPGNVLILNSMKPLNHDNHVWFETPIELMFSQVLAQDQEELFEVEVIKEDASYPLEGNWILSGRAARFEPSEALEQETHYEIHVADGLKGRFGEELKESIDLQFRTGGTPEFDTSGEWLVTVTITQPFSASESANVAVIQSQGGKVAGVVIDDFEEGTLDHVEGVMSGVTLILEPFMVQSVLGEIMVDHFECVMQDTDGDGYADYGTGSITALGQAGDVIMERTNVLE
jgi:DNA-binding beta-propeller fold protein YncE